MLDEEEGLDPEDGREGGQEHDPSGAEEALAEVQAQLQASQAREENERQARITAEEHARHAGGQAQHAQSFALDAVIAAEEARYTTARAAFKAAREAGDVDAEADASAEMSSARTKIDRGKEEKGRQPKPNAAPPQSNQPALSQAAQEWIRAHPRFTTDVEYRAVATAADTECRVRHITLDSPQYFEVLNKAIAARFSEDQGGPSKVQNKGQQPPAPARRTPPASSFATPQGRGAATNARGTHDAVDIASKLGVTVDDLKQAAEWSDMPWEKYLASQDAILKERGAGNITYGDGKVFR